MGGSSGGDQTTRTEPWDGQKEYLTDIYKRAQTAYGDTSKTPYGGPLNAPITPAQWNATGQTAATGSHLVGAGSNLLQKASDATKMNWGDGPQLDRTGTSVNWNYNPGTSWTLDPTQNTNFMPALQAGLDENTQLLKRSILPQISSQAQLSGAYGGARHGIAESNAISDVTRNNANAAAKAVWDAYAFEREGLAKTEQLGNQLTQDSAVKGASIQADLAKAELAAANARWQSQLENATKMGTLGLASYGQGTQQLQGSADTQHGYNQIPVDELIARWEMEQQGPWQGLSNYSSIVQNGFPGGTSTTTGGRPSAAAGALAGGLGGAGIGYMMAPMLGMAGPWGAAAGAGIGLLSGLLR